jgi:ActR/RegA family two-component response regulator
METARVLIVEDRQDYQKIFITIVGQRLKYEYKIAASVEECKELLRQFSFHIALVDLSLDDNDHDNRDGFKVLDLIKQLDEGTQSMILTAYGKIKDVDRVILENYHLLGFIDKGDMDVQEVADRIKDGAHKAHQEMQKPSRGMLDIRQILSEKPVEWLVSKIDGDASEPSYHKIDEMESLLRRLLANFHPLLPKREQPELFLLERQMRVVRARFWSKMLGCAIEVWVGSYNSIESVTQLISESIILKQEGYEKRIRVLLDNLEFPDYGGVVYKLVNTDFNEFLDSSL